MDYGGRVDVVGGPYSDMAFLAGALTMLVLFVVLPYMLYWWDKHVNGK